MATADQATDLHQPMANGAVRFYDLDFRRTFKGLNCLGQLRLTEMDPCKWSPEFCIVSDFLDSMKLGPSGQRNVGS